MITMTSLITICYHTKSLQHWDRAVLNKTYSLKKKINQKFCLHIAEANLKTNDIVKKKKLRLQLMVLTMSRKRSDASSVHDAEQTTSGGPHA